MAVLIRSPLLVRCCSPNGNGSVGNGSVGTARAKQVKPSFTRFDFPEGFTFGSASSAYQIEGAWNTDGKGPSIWDTYTHQHPEKIADHSNGDIAIDSFHRYKEDVQLMKQMGCEAYRFSIAWTRILPRGNLKGGVNMAGIKHYSQFIDYIMSQGLKPFATLFHWDVPQALEDEYGGFLSAKIVKDFHDYADICFEEFGDRVKHWITINEPHTFCVYGYGTGVHAPGRCSPYIGNCSGGDSATEPYKVGHHLLLSHADAVKLYREKYRVFQEGTIGLSLDSRCIIPLSDTMSDYDAAQRAIDFELGWFMDPLTCGQYPLNMKSRVRERLPEFTVEESQMVKGSYDFIGINYYTGNYACDIPPIDNILPSYMTDARAFLIGERNGRHIGQQAVSSWLYAFAQGLHDLLLYVKERYNNPPIYITENGMDQANLDVSVEEALRDNMRVYYFTNHLGWLLRAIKRGVDVRGHFSWTICDNFEWADGYTIRFGINYVDYKDNLKRYAKNSAIWFQNFLNGYTEYEKIDYTNYKELVRTTLGD